MISNIRADFHQVKDDFHQVFFKKQSNVNNSLQDLIKYIACARLCLVAITFGVALKLAFVFKAEPISQASTILRIVVSCVNLIVLRDLFVILKNVTILMLTQPRRVEYFAAPHLHRLSLGTSIPQFWTFCLDKAEVERI